MSTRGVVSTRGTVSARGTAHARCAGRARLSVVLAFVLAAGFAMTPGCAVGPNFHAPPSPQLVQYTRAALPEATGSDAQRFLKGADVPRQWWTQFKSQELDALVADALAHNPSVDYAQAALRQANELVAAQRGSYLPTVQASYTASRQRNAVDVLAPTLTSGDPVFNLHTAQVNVSYVIDLFGANRRQVEALVGQADAQRWQLAATYLTLSSNVVVATITEAALRAQLDATQGMVRSEAETLEIMQRQEALGLIAGADVAAQESQLAATQALIAPLEKQLAQQRDLLAVLTGRFPSDALTTPVNFAALELPRDLPVSLPSQLVRQRPDVLIAEAQLHAATAAVGVAIADLLPQITLDANAGSVGTALDQLLHSGHGFWSAGASLSQTLVAGGTLWHRKRAADAALDQAGAQYRTAVLAAFQNVADALQALASDAGAVTAERHALQAATDSLEIARHNVEYGSVSALALLSAEQSCQQAQTALIAAQAAQYTDTAALFQALGGGWR